MTGRRRPPLALREYGRALRRRWFLIVVMAIVGGGAAFLHADREPVRYTASSVLRFTFRDQSMVNPLGDVQVPTLTPAELVAMAQTIDRNDRLTRVRRAMRTGASNEMLAAALTAQADPKTGLLVITATSRNPRFATGLVDSVARDVVTAYNRRKRAQLEAVVRQVRRGIAELERHGSTTTRFLVAKKTAQLRTLRGLRRILILPTPAPSVAAAMPRRPMHSASLGLLFGLLAGALTACVAASVDRRLRNERDVQAHLELPMLGRVTEDRLGAIIDPDDLAGDGGIEADEFRRIRHGLELLGGGSPMRLVLVTSAVPEEGKSTVSGSLALFMAAAGKRTLLLECDFRRPVLADRLGIPRTPGLRELLSGEATLEDVVRPVASDRSVRLDADSGGTPMETHTVSCIPAGEPTSIAAELLGSERFAALLADLRDEYQAVLLDAAPILPVADVLEILPRVDGVLLCVRVMRTSRHEALAAKAALQNLPLRPTGLVVTGASRLGHEPAGYAYARAPAVARSV